MKRVHVDMFEVSSFTKKPRKRLGNHCTFSKISNQKTHSNLKMERNHLLFNSSFKEDGQKLLDFRGRFDSGYGEPSTSGIPGMKRRY